MTTDPRAMHPISKGRDAASGNARLPYDGGGFWDEMFDADGLPRAHYSALAQRLQALSPPEVARRQAGADHSFRGQGITFAVTDDPSGIEKILPFDLIPRLIDPDEWRRIESGLEQRVRALNLFLADIYHGQRILADGT